MYEGSCHCGKVAFRVDAEIPEKVTRCTCSFCSKRGHLFAYCAPEAFTLTSDVKDLGTHRWQTGLVAHHHCPNCGCATHSDSPAFERDGSWDGETRRIGVNMRLVTGFDAAEAPVTVIDGKNLW